MDPTEKKPEREIWDAESERRRSRNLKRKRMRNPKPKPKLMELPEKIPKIENLDAFADTAKKSVTERRRSRKRLRKPNPKTLVLASDSDLHYNSLTYSDHEAEARRRKLDNRYHMQVRESDGFDVDMYRMGITGQIIPCDIDIYSDVAIKFGKFAVDDYNQKQPEGGINLAFVRPLKCNIQHSTGVTYYITFEAKDVDAPHDQSRIYQSKVFDGFKKPLEVIIFRPKLTTSTPDRSEITTEPLDDNLGYDVTGIHDCMIEPMKLNYENTKLATKLGECALKSYHRQKKRKQERYKSGKQQEKGRLVMLKFLQPLKMNSQKLKDGYIRYYLTFHAKAVGVPDDQSAITYQTQVSVYNGVVKVARFRPKPTANPNSSG